MATQKKKNPRFSRLVIAKCRSKVFLTCTKLTHGFKTFILSIFEWLLKAGFTVPLTNADADTSSTAIVLIVSLSLYLHPYILYVRNKDSGGTARMHRLA